MAGKSGKKERLDVLLVERGFFQSRERAKASIMAGTVFVDGQRSDKAGTKIDVEAEIDVKEDDCPYVSRGGYKLEKSIEAFGIDLTGLTCMDIGASTGGFTDCMLQNGAQKVYAVDVGYGQLAWKLRTDPRVVNIEKCNVRYLEPERIGEPVDFVSIDVSFISLKLILPVAKKVLKDQGRLVCLVKPQFEAGKEEMRNTKGVVRDPAVHEEVIRKAIGYAEDNGFTPLGLTCSPVKGAKGNVEFLMYLAKDYSENQVGKDADLRYNLSGIKNVVAEAQDL